VIVYDPLQAFTQCLTTKVDEQTKRKMHQPQITQHLLSMGGSQPLDRLNLYQQRAVDEKIGAERALKPHAIEVDIDRALPLDPIARRSSAPASTTS